MALTAGARVGPYEIVAKIGEGGMGEVYRARHSELGRDVAIKILGPDLIGTSDAVARFEREARTCSALNHPHIVHIYDIGDVQTPSGPTRYIAMEYVAGETLRTRLRNGVRWPDLIEHLAQVADALAKAHGAGIVHRDLKPDNVMVSFDGYVKVVDFGLAKLIEETTMAASSEAQLRSRTGAIVGTVGYMSPEQAQGLPLDGRSDIFALGCILFEALAGRPPFKGSTALDTMHAVVHDEPPSIDALSPQSPPELRALAVHCLAKDPGKRPQSAADVARDLRAFLRGRDSAATISLDRRAGPNRARLRPAVVWPAAAAVILAVVSIGLWQRATPDTPLAGARGSDLGIEKVTNRGNAINPAISPDGRYLAYSSSEGVRPSIWLRDLSQKTETRLVGPLDVELSGVGLSIHFGERGENVYYSFIPQEGAGLALYRVPIIGGAPRRLREAPSRAALGTVSPDERHLAYRRGAGDERRIVIADMTSGEERPIADSHRARELAWSRDGGRLLFGRRTDVGEELFVVNADGSNQRRAGAVGPGLTHARWNVAGTVIACVIDADDATQQLVVVDLATGDTRPVGTRRWTQVDELSWLPDGKHLVATDVEPRDIWLVSYPAGNTARLTTSTSAYRQLALAADGTQLVTVETSVRSDLLVASDSSGGSFKRIVGGTNVLYSLCWTSDESIIYSSNEAGSYDLYVVNTDGSSRRQLTFDRPGNETQPSSSRDGQHIVFVSDRGGRPSIYRMNADGSGMQALTSATTDRGDFAPQVTPDGRSIVYVHWDNGPTLWKLPIEGGTPVLVKGARTLDTGDVEESAYGASVSPDGRALAFFHFSSDPATRRFSSMDVVTSSLDAQTIMKRFPYRNLPTIVEHERVQWSADGRSLYYRVFKDGITNLWRQPVDGQPGAQVTQFEEDLGDFDWSFDGKMLAASRSSSTQDVVVISNFVR